MTTILIVLCSALPATTISYTEMKCSLYEAGIPEYRHEEFLSVAWCESGWNPEASGDGGKAEGAFQIWPLWPEWAEQQGHGWLDRNHLVDAAKLAYLIGQRDLERGQPFWKQWSVSPLGEECNSWKVSFEEEIALWNQWMNRADQNWPALPI